MKSWTAIGLGVVAVAAGAWWIVSSQFDDAPAADGAASASTTTVAPSTTAAPSPNQPGVEVDVEGVLGEFGGLWESADWDGMARIASDAVVAVAQEWGQPMSVAVVWADHCGLDNSTAGSCELLVVPLDGGGLIFRASYRLGSDTALMFDDLEFNGDAG